MLLLELPTSGFADGFGYFARSTSRPAAVNVAAACAYLVATTFWMFALGACLMGVFRALDSGPLEAWYVDTVHLTGRARPPRRRSSPQALVLGASLAPGALLAGLLGGGTPVDGSFSLVVPIVLFAALNVLHLAAVAVLLREPSSRGRRPADALRSLRAAPGVVANGLHLLGRNPVLRWLVLVEVFWCLGMVVFEQLNPIRLAELLGDQEMAATWMGPVAAAGWADLDDRWRAGGAAHAAVRRRRRRPSPRGSSTASARS